MRINRIKRNGIASVLAMLYMVLFAALAIGFYAAVTMAVQVVGNEQKISRAMLAAESGMQFIRYHLSNVSIPHGTTTDQFLSKVYDHLYAQLNNTPNLGAGTVGAVGNTICIPLATGSYINADSTGSRFRISITQVADKLIVKVVGRHNSDEIVRAIQLDYGIAQNASAIFDYGVASRGRIVTAGQAKIRGATDPTKGSVLSTNTTALYPVWIDGKEVSGDISIANPGGGVYFHGASIGGTSSEAEILANHIHKGVQPPEFPTIDTEVFRTYATNMYSAGMTTLDNCRIPANTNPKFTGGVNIKGVLYVEAPNAIEFGGNVSIQGCIVVQNGVSTDLTKNVLAFTGSVDARGVETLPVSYGDLRKLTGSFILAPGFLTNFTGSFGTVNGSIISSQVTMTGNAGGTVMGTVINQDDTTLSLSGSSEIIIASTGTNNYPSGVYFGSHFAPLPDTYSEVQP